jgi:hypothetical protein
MRTLPRRELPQHVLRGTLVRMKLRDQYAAAGWVRRWAPRSIEACQRCREERLHVQHACSGRGAVIGMLT